MVPATAREHTGAARAGIVQGAPLDGVDVDGAGQHSDGGEQPAGRGSIQTGEYNRTPCVNNALTSVEKCIQVVGAVVYLHGMKIVSILQPTPYTILRLDILC